jgi:hypothetical protein
MLLAAIERVRRLLVRRVAAHSLLLTVRDVAVALLVLGLAGALFPLPRVAMLLSVLAVGAVSAVVVLRVVRPLLLLPSVPATAEELDRTVPSLRGIAAPAVDLVRRPSPHAGVSGDLTEAAIAQAAEHIAAVDPHVLAHRRVRRLPRAQAAASVAALILVVCAWPGGVGRALIALAEPGNVREPVVTISVQPGDAIVRAGAAVPIAARIEGLRRGLRETPTLWVRARGGDWRTISMRQSGAPASEARKFAARIDQVDQETVYRVALGKHRSRDYAIRILADASVLNVHVAYTYPAYSKLAPDAVDQPTGDLAGLEGTAADVSFRLSVPMAAARMVFDDPEVAPVRLLARENGSVLQGRVRIMRPTRYHLAVTQTGEGGAEQVLGASYVVSPSTDAPPVVRLLAPDEEMQLPREMQVTLHTEALDDFGLTSVALVSWKDGATTRTRRVLASPRGAREDRRQSDWDLQPYALTPGQSLLYYVEATDNNAVRGPQVARTSVHKITFPTLAEIYAQASDEHRETATQLSDLLEQGRSLKKDLESMSRDARTNKTMSWEDKKALQQALDQQKTIAENLDQASRQLGETLQKLEQQTSVNEELLRKVAEVQKLVQNIGNKELKQALERLSQALHSLNPQDVKSALSQLQLTQEELLKSLDRTIQLLSRIQREEKLEALAQKLENLAAQQKQLNDQMKSASSNEQRERNAEDEARLSKETQDAKQDAQSLSQEMKQDEPQTSEDLQQASQEMENRDISGTMERAAEMMRQGNKSGASSKGQKAEKDLSQMAEQVRRAQKNMQSAQNQAMAREMESIAHDMLTLSSQQEAMSTNTQGQTTTDLAEKEGMIGEETGKVADRLFKLGQKTPFITQDLASSIGGAQKSSQESAEGFEKGNRGQGERQAREASRSLNSAVLQLLQAKESACNGGSGGSASQSLMKKLAALGQMQSQLNGETQQLMPNGQRLTPSVQGQLARMAAQQEMIRQGLSDLAREAGQTQQQIGKLGPVGEEMKSVAQDLAQNNVTPETLDRQHKILSRLLDAQHAAEKRDFERRRSSEAGVNVAQPSPGPIPSSALSEKDRITIDLMRAHSDPVPPEYRHVIDAYFRALSGSSR